jgi:hypothetical protein
VRIHLAAEHAFELEVAYLALEALCVALDVARGALIALGLGQLEQLDRLGNAATGAVDLADVARQPGALAPELLGARRIGPYLRILELAGDLLETLELAVVLKETPGARGCARRDL